jgi:hypothetical protein
LSVFPAHRVVVLGGTLHDVLQKAGMCFKPELPPFSSIKDFVRIESHPISFDTSGADPKVVTSISRAVNETPAASEDLAKVDTSCPVLSTQVR